MCERKGNYCQNDCSSFQRELISITEYVDDKNTKEELKNPI